jgi:hypothetical protein
MHGCHARGVQAGDDDILRQMLRGYTSARYREIIHNIRRYMPDASISGDAIVGFPGAQRMHCDLRACSAPLGCLSALCGLLCGTLPGVLCGTLPGMLCCMLCAVLVASSVARLLAWCVVWLSRQVRANKQVDAAVSRQQ